MFFALFDSTKLFTHRMPSSANTFRVCMRYKLTIYAQPNQTASAEHMKGEITKWNRHTARKNVSANELKQERMKRKKAKKNWNEDKASHSETELFSLLIYHWLPFVVLTSFVFFIRSHIHSLCSLFIWRFWLLLNTVQSPVSACVISNTLLFIIFLFFGLSSRIVCWDLVDLPCLSHTLALSLSLFFFFLFWQKFVQHHPGLCDQYLSQAYEK